MKSIMRLIEKLGFEEAWEFLFDTRLQHPRRADGTLDESLWYAETNVPNKVYLVLFNGEDPEKMFPSKLNTGSQFEQLEDTPEEYQIEDKILDSEPIFFDDCLGRIVYVSSVDPSEESPFALQTIVKDEKGTRIVETDLNLRFVNWSRPLRLSLFDGAGESILEPGVQEMAGLRISDWLLEKLSEDEILELWNR